MARTSKVCQILLAPWSGLRYLGVMTITRSHDQDVICPVDTAGFCTWMLRVSKGKFGHSSETQQERGKISPYLVWFSWTTVPAITNYSSTGRKRGQERERRKTEIGQKGGKKQSSGFKGAACSSVKGLAISLLSIPLCCPRRCCLTA